MHTQLHSDVLIVGAGPTGLMLANQLQRFGLDFIIIDVKNNPQSPKFKISSWR